LEWFVCTVVGALKHMRSRITNSSELPRIF